MNKYSVKAAACALVGTLSLSGYQMTLEAKIHNSSDVPAAGVAVVLDESSTIQDLQVEVVQNIAYLESASGLQPNIIKATEKAALTETMGNVVLANTARTVTTEISPEFTQELSEALSEVDSEFPTEPAGSETQQEASTESTNSETQQEVSTESTNSEASAEISTELKTEWDVPELESLTQEKASAAETPNTETSDVEISNTETSNPEISNPEASDKEASAPETSVETSEQEASGEESEQGTTETSGDDTSNEKTTDEEESEQETSTQDASETESTEKSSSEQETLTQDASETESTEEKTSETESTEEKTSETESIEEETSEPETNEEAGNTDSTDTTDNNFQTSAGFSATDTYEDVELDEKSENEAETEAKEDGQDFSGLVIAQVTNYVNVRSTPGEDGEVVGKLYSNSVGELIEEENGWYKIVSGNCTGYVKGEFCAAGKEAESLAKEVGTTYAVVNTTTLKVRQDASTESSVLGLVPINEELVVLEELDGWVKIAIEEGDGYVSRDYINLRTDFVHAESKEEEAIRLAKEAKAREEARAAAAATETARLQKQAEAQAQRSATNQATIEAARNTASSSEGSEMGKAVIDYATQFVGNPYVYGGSSLTNGTDCSGFVMSVYNNFGVSLPHSSSALRNQGYDVGGLANAQPGDIVCYSGHVGLYVGNGQIVHASTSKTGIIVSNAAYRNVLSVRRIF